jgi:putative protease
MLYYNIIMTNSQARPVELLAPAGNFEIFSQIVGTPCDALYFGGKRFNMRLHRKDFNFGDEELREAVRLSHERGKKAYITVNNMYTEGDLPGLMDYLAFLEELGPDGILVQDFAVIALVQEMGLPLTLHSSVMMNVHNFPMIKRLEALGVRRVVLSRELPLSYIRWASEKTTVEFEYFVHGDMCISCGGQCLYSGIVFGSSGNQGRCLKPCRWGFAVEQGGRRWEPGFPLAARDMYLYEHIPELIFNGVKSFKIEGRMRDAAYIAGLVEAYGEAIDRYLADPAGFDRFAASEQLYENRKRDFTTAFAFGSPGRAYLNRRMEGTGAFYSTGKVFSVATEEPDLSPERIAAMRETIRLQAKVDAPPPLQLAARAATLAQARFCIERGVDRVYLAGDVFQPEKPFTLEEIGELVQGKKSSEIYISQGRMTGDLQLENFRKTLERLPAVDGVVVSSLGGLVAARDFAGERGARLVGDYGLNIQNSAAWNFYRGEGLSLFTISAEIHLPDLLDLLPEAGPWGELIIFGAPSVMYLEHDLYEWMREEGNRKWEIGNGGDNLLPTSHFPLPTDTLFLLDEKGFRHPVYRDQDGKNHILLYKDISCLPFLSDLRRAGLVQCRFEGGHLAQADYEAALIACQEAAGGGEPALQPPRGGFTPGALAFSACP